MLELADSVWGVISGALAFFAGLLLIVRQRAWFGVPLNQALAFYCSHSAFCLFYFYYSLTGAADATGYFLRSLEYNGGPDVGTKGIYFLTSIFSSSLGMSYGGVFLVYNLFGFIGMLALAGALREILADSPRVARQVAILAMLTPGLSFWSAAIGKDALSFMAAGLAVWSAMHLDTRYPAIVISSLALLLVRPHISGILLGSLAIAAAFGARMSTTKKLIFVVVTIPAAIIGGAFGAQYAGLGDAAGVEDVEAYFQTRQSHNLGGGSAVDIASMSIPGRMMSYLFRPLFFDASGLLGLVVSVENLFLVVLFGYAAGVSFLGRRSSLDSFALLFFLVYCAASWFVLANTTANLGIAIRQKWMFLPMLFAIAFSLMPQQRPCLSSFLPSRRAGSASRWSRTITKKDANWPNPEAAQLED